MPEPEDCTSLEEVRAGIDALDHSIVQALGRRARYVRAAARFKTDAASVRPRTACKRCSGSAAPGRPRLASART